jgi:tRNA(Ile2) C34 agmatinyltransferase TiaS
MTLADIIPPDPDLPPPESAPFCPTCLMAMTLEYLGWRCEVCGGGYRHDDGSWVTHEISRWWAGR